MKSGGHRASCRWCQMNVSLLRTRRRGLRPRAQRACALSALLIQFPKANCALRWQMLLRLISLTGPPPRYIICLTDGITMGRTIVIGDIHGCFEELQDLLR